MKDITDHPDYDPADFEKKCCNGSGLIEVNGEVESCPTCEAIIKKYQGYWGDESPNRTGDDIPF